jgi:hypothetical protein
MPQGDRLTHWINQPTNSIELSPSWETASCSTTKEFPNILWNMEVHYHAHNSPPLAPILSHINPVHTTPSYLRSILILSTHLHLGLPSGLFPSHFPTKLLYAFFFSLLYTTCPAHNILLDLIILIDLGKEYKLWSSSFCSFLQPPITSSPLPPSPNTLLSHPSRRPFVTFCNKNISMARSC